MAAKKIQRTHTTAKTVYVIVLRDSDGYLRDDADGSFAAAPADKYLSLAEHAVIKGLYEASVNDIPWSDGLYTIVAYEQAGAAPAPATDLVIDDEPQRLAVYADSAAAEPGTLLATVQGLVKDTDAKLSDADWASGISGALARYSKHRPKISVADIEGDGTNLYDAPAGWVDEFSRIKSIEYPVGDNPETLLDSEDDYRIYQTADAEKIRLVNASPDSPDTFRVSFTVPRTEATIPANDLTAVANLAAHICLGMLASRYIGTGDSTLQADAVSYRTKSQECASRAKACLTFYNEHLDLKDGDTLPAASVVGSRTLNYPGGGDRLTHPRSARRLR
jgi:hypothetical protein